MPKASAGKRGIRRIGISTGGGDAPGLNAVIRAVVLAGHNHGWEVVGIRDGYNGIFLPDQYRDGGLIPLTPEAPHMPVPLLLLGLAGYLALFTFLGARSFEKRTIL